MVFITSRTESSILEFKRTSFWPAEINMQLLRKFDQVYSLLRNECYNWDPLPPKQQEKYESSTQDEKLMGKHKNQFTNFST